MAHSGYGETGRIDRRGFLRVAGIGVAGTWLAGLAGCSSESKGSSGAAASAGAPVGDATSSAAEATVKKLSFFFWGQGTVSKRYTDAVAKYEEAHRGLTVDCQYVNHPSYDTKLSTEIAGGNAPSIFEVAIESEKQYLSRGAARKLTDLVPSVLPFDKLPAGLQDYCKYNGEWYLIPTGIATKPAVVYNKTLLQKLNIAIPGQNWTTDDLAKLSVDVNKASGGKLYGITDLSGNDWAFSPYVRGLGKSMFTQDGKLGFSKDDLASWFEYWDRLRKDKGVGPMDLTVGTGSGKLQATDEVIKGQAAMTLESSSKGLLGLQKLTKDELGLLPFPKHSADGPAATVVRPIEWFVLSSKLSNAEAKTAAELCMNLINDEQTLATLDLAHGVPLFPEVRDKMYPAQSAINKLIFDDVKASLAQNPPTEYPYPSGAPDLVKALETQAEAIGYKKTTIAKAVDAWFAQAEKSLS